MSQHTIYLDHAAATPLDQRVFKAMQPYFSDQFYNPSAPYQPAREVKKAIEAARAQSAAVIGAKSSEIIFTAGSTESINLAFHGLLGQGGNCVVSNIEHQAVLETAQLYNHTIVSVDQRGRLSPVDVTKAIDDNTILISVGMVNSEIGVIQDIKSIAAALKTARKQREANRNHTPLLFHTDATQAAGLLDMSVARLGVDLLSLGGNKIYGPKQTGLLYRAGHVGLRPLIYGSGHEQNLRSGTENVPGIIGLSHALAVAAQLRVNEDVRLRELKHDFIKKITRLLPDTVILGDQKHSTSHIVMIAWADVDAERLVFQLEEKGVLVGTGAACAAKKDGYSHVLKALHTPQKLMAGSLRLSFGRTTTLARLGRAAKIIAQAVKRERR